MQKGVSRNRPDGQVHDHRIDRPDTAPHTHPYEQINLLVEGDLDFIVGNERILLEQYDIVEIPIEIEHASRTVSDDPAILLTYWPLRENRLAETQYQAEFNIE